MLDSMPANPAHSENAPVETKPDAETVGEDVEEDISFAVDEGEQLLAFIFFALAGSTARSGLNSLLKFEGLGPLWANFTGCFAMAFIPAIAEKRLTPLLGVAFCGSLTSFSEVITDIFTASTTRAPNWKNDGYSVPLFMAQLLIELGCCFAAYQSGAHLLKLWRHFVKYRLKLRHERILRQIFAVLGIAGWVPCIVTAITTKSSHRQWALFGVFAPFGVYGRFYLSKLNGKHWFKVGTFIANVVATLTACILELCNQLPNITPLQRDMMAGIQSGFAGSLSTMSTFVKEMNTMPVRYGYAYGLISLFVGYALAFIIIGSYKWTRS